MNKQPITRILSRSAIVTILILGAYAAFIRFFNGLGDATNLHDSFPWGIWIGFDVLVGVGLAAGGFTVAATVHIFNMRKYECISRPSLMTAFLGYLLVVVALLFDIGRPLRLWHPLIMWNPHSVMFEVAWCVTLYTLVLALEFSPLVFERFKLHVPLMVVRTIYLPLVISGVLLSTLHQSSLGTVYLIVPEKLYGLWYSSLLPVFFFLTAIAAGLSMTIVESFLSARAFGKRIEHDVLCGLARVTVVVLAVVVMWKFVDLANRGNLHLAFEFSRESVMFWAEIGIGAFLPALLLFLAGDRIAEEKLFLSAVLVVVGFVLNRLNVSVTGMLHSETYIPKWTELAITASMVIIGVLVFRMAVQHLRIFVEEGEEAVAPVKPNTSLPMRTVLALVLVVVLVASAFTVAPPGRMRTKVQSMAAAPRKVDPMQDSLPLLPEDRTIASTGASPGKVTFRHSTHIELAEKRQCIGCHPRPFEFNLTMGSKRLAGEQWHSAEACGSCHDGKRAFNTQESCQSCHAEVSR